jgi:hypothetical protein
MKATNKEKHAMREYYKQNKDKFSEYNKKRWKIYGELLSLKHKKWYQENKAKVLEHQRKDRLLNPEKYRQKNIEHYQKYREKYIKQKREYYLKNRDIILKKEKMERKKYPQKFYARDIARHKIEIPKDQICVVCNKNPATQREHRDYSKPLDISFVCGFCNKQLGGGINAK